MNSKIGLILDFDGVVSDSIPGAYAGVLNVFDNSGVRPPTYEVFLQTFQAPYVECYRKWGIKASEEEIFTWYHERANHGEASMFDDVPKVLAIFANELEATIGIVTAQRQEVVNRRVRAYAIQEFVEYLACDVQNKAPALRQFCSDFFIPGWNTWFVGDFPSDMRDGRAAGVRCVGITRGNPTEDILFAAGAEYVTENLEELLGIIGISIKKRT